MRERPILVTGEMVVRVERVQDISEADAKAEGTSLAAVAGTLNGQPAELHPMSYRQAFAWLWDSINESRGFGWNVNPWVWCVEFRVLEVSNA